MLMEFKLDYGFYRGPDREPLCAEEIQKIFNTELSILNFNISHKKHKGAIKVTLLWDHEDNEEDGIFIKVNDRVHSLINQSARFVRKHFEHFDEIYVSLVDRVE